LQFVEFREGLGRVPSVRVGRMDRAVISRHGIARALRYSRDVFRYGRGGVRMKRSDGAKVWSTVLSELAQGQSLGGVGAPRPGGSSGGTARLERR
jgi:hypothetical protein